MGGEEGGGEGFEVGGEGEEFEVGRGEWVVYVGEHGVVEVGEVVVEDCGGGELGRERGVGGAGEARNEGG